MGWFFVLFLLSGFCSILYEIVWLRLAMAQFGVTSALVAIVLSTFMAGLALGSWVSGRLFKSYLDKVHIPALRVYATAEFLIAISGLLVPYEFGWGRGLLERTSVSSPVYYLASGIWIALSIIPWCTCMGATIPLAMAAIKQTVPGEKPSFSFLYLGNVVGAVFGAIVPLLLIEMYGFRGTLKIGVALNSILALLAIAVSRQDHATPESPASLTDSSLVATPDNEPVRNSMLLILLFATGLTSMGMEVVWIRQFTPYLGTMVYSFALILAIYLACTSIGSRTCRRKNLGRTPDWRLLWAFLGPLALLPLVTASPNLHLSGILRLMIGIGPFSAVLGFITPTLVDRWAGGEPEGAGKAYAVNVVGCILGPLLAGFFLLPVVGERWSLFALSLPFLAVLPWQPSLPGKSDKEHKWLRYASYALAAVALVFVVATKGYEEQFARRIVLRDSTATIIATGEGRDKRLLVNGVGITFLTPITKMMAHLPLAFLDHRPQNALVVCFGMGTSYRSILSWNIPTTAVELVPSVPDVFWYYHADAAQLLRSPLSRIVIDDGRRYLERTPEQFDVITIDPPPPVHAAGSSLLYSREFYSIVGRRLRPGGVLQQWLPRADSFVRASVARALSESFPYVRVFPSVEGWGFHFLASDKPLPHWNEAELVQHTPRDAVKDLMEWGPQPTAERQFAVVLEREVQIDEMIKEAPDAPALHDDHPINEYYALRNWNSTFRQSLWPMNVLHGSGRPDKGISQSLTPRK